MYIYIKVLAQTSPCPVRCAFLSGGCLAIT